MNSLMKPAESSRPPAVAGLFYPADPAELRSAVQRYLGGLPAPDRAAAMPKALIAPHAGYVYSGPIAACAYARLLPRPKRIRRVVLLGPVHRVPVRGLALPSVERFDTPLGPVEVDAEARALLQELPQVGISDRAHAAEHSLEVQLPFLQQILGRFTLVPLAVGDATPEEVAAVLERLWGGDETLIVISSDLSHYLPYAAARSVDRATAETMLALAPTLDHEQACGATPVNGLLALARRRGLRAELLDLRNSGDTAGDRSRVVGYAAVAFFEAVPARRDVGREAGAQIGLCGPTLLAHARAAIARRLGLTAPEAPHAPFLDEAGATFVTLKAERQLRGCVGTLDARRSLGEDVRANAQAAAFDDPRFPPLARVEYDALEVEVSVLSASTPIVVASERELHARLRPGVDGVTLQWRGRRGTFLPQVWESLPDPQEFIAQLKLKAGLPLDFWSGDLEIFRYSVEKFTEGQAA
ncbi:MAG TPA: AmmeMemoRadiSam system protein B [Burkholderiaceae bacterium]|nr:AmmeMemoRadiSam system protein B [Burkholderiaceae bacterium]